MRVVAVVVRAPDLHWHVGHSFRIQYPSDSNGRHLGPEQCEPTVQRQFLPPLIAVLFAGHSVGTAQGVVTAVTPVVIVAAVTAAFEPSSPPPHTQHASFAVKPWAPGTPPSRAHLAGASLNQLQLKADPSPSCQGAPEGSFVSVHSPSASPSPPSRLLLPEGATHLQSGHVTVSKYHSETSPLQPSPTQAASSTQRHDVPPL